MKQILSSRNPIASVLLFALLFSGCAEILTSPPADETILAEPIEGMTQQQLREHIIGDQRFAEIFGAAEGLGPGFVSNACESCHIGDGKGHPLTTLTRFGKYTDGIWDPLIAHGGPQLQNRAILGFLPEEIPAGATGVARFLPPAVTGLGYLAALTDQTLLDLADPNDLDGDGISGTLNYIDAPDFFVPRADHIPLNGQYIGRFGRKAGAVNLLHQTAAAYVQDMGITSDFFPHDNVNPLIGNTSGDEIVDPEVQTPVVNSVVFYLRTLKAPPRRNKDDADVLAGESLFNQINCSGCHVSTLTTGVSDVEVLSEKTFYPYSDMLMHDMGPNLDDNYTEGTALTSEWRTTPLWGIGLGDDSQGGKSYYLHDGRTSSLTEAITLHGGEAEASKNAFVALSESEKEQVLAFLKSL